MYVFGIILKLYLAPIFLTKDPRVWNRLYRIYSWLNDYNFRRKSPIFSLPRAQSLHRLSAVPQLYLCSLSAVSLQSLSSLSVLKLLDESTVRIKSVKVKCVLMLDINFIKSYLSDRPYISSGREEVQLEGTEPTTPTTKILVEIAKEQPRWKKSMKLYNTVLGTLILEIVKPRPKTQTP